MNTTQAKHTVSALIIDNKLSEALALLKSSFRETEVDLVNEVILLESKLRELARHERVGDLTRDDIVLERNKIKLSILNLVGELERFGKETIHAKDNKTAESKSSLLNTPNIRRIVVSIIALAFLFIAGFLIYQYQGTTPKKFTFPIKIAVFGPISGELKTFGLSHARGVVGGCMHFLKEVIGEDPENVSKYFTFTFYDTGDPNGQFTKNRDKLEADYLKAQETNDFVFGPLSSEISKELLLKRHVHLLVPTFITLAATPAIREHPQYGKLLFQLSNNIDSYARQITSYFANFSNPKPKEIFCIYRNDEYGISSSKALGKYALENNFTFSQIEYDLSADFQKGTQTDSSLIAFISKIKEKGKDAVVMVVAVGDDLLKFFNWLKEKTPEARLSTLSTVERDQIKKGYYDGVYLIYSYVPGSVSLQTLQFHRNTKLAEVVLNEIMDARFIPSQWHEPNTADAEVHDTAIYFLSTYCLNSFDKRNSNWSSDYYALCVTDFMLAGKGTAVGNEGSLFIFQVKDTEMLPVKTEL